MANEDKFKMARKALAEKKARKKAIKTYNDDVNENPGSERMNFAFSQARGYKQIDNILNGIEKRYGK